MIMTSNTGLHAALFPVNPSQEWRAPPLTIVVFPLTFYKLHFEYRIRKAF